MILSIVETLQNFNNANRIALVVALLGLLGVLLTAFFSYRISLRVNKINIQANDISKEANEISEKLGKLGVNTQDKQRFIGTISVQRVEWINNIRKTFADFNKGIYIYGNLINKELNTNYEMTNEENYILPEIVYNKDLMELYLNPTEIVSKKLIHISHELLKYLANPPADNYTFQHVLVESQKILYFQQVILKAEWKRLKKETENGKEIDDQEMGEIFIEVAETINSDSYNLFLKESFN